MRPEGRFREMSILKHVQYSHAQLSPTWNEKNQDIAMFSVKSTPNSSLDFSEIWDISLAKHLFQTPYLQEIWYAKLDNIPI